MEEHYKQHKQKGFARLEKAFNEFSATSSEKRPEHLKYISFHCDIIRDFEHIGVSPRVNDELDTFINICEKMSMTETHEQEEDFASTSRAFEVLFLIESTLGIA